MVSKVKVDSIETTAGTGTIALNNQLSGMTVASLPSSGALPALDGSALTSLTSGNLSGALPALDGSSLTGVGVTGIVSSANATAITINSSEQVGIGTTINPHNAPLYVKGGINCIEQLTISKPDATTRNWRFLPNNNLYDLDIQCTQSDNTSESVQATNFASILDLRHDGRGLSSFTAKAWVKFSHNGMGNSHNMSSFTDNGTGDWSFSFTNTLTNGSYGVGGMAHSYMSLGFGAATSSSSIRVKSYSTQSGSLQDGDWQSFVIFGI